jgi:hypothetical protein
MAPILALFAARICKMPFNLRAEDTAEFSRLCDALPVAIERASSVLRKSFSDAAVYVAADAEVSQILARITLLTHELK